MIISLRTYADAYVQAFPAKGDVVKAFDAMADVIRSTTPLRAFLEDESVPIASRRKALTEALPGVEDETVNFITLLATDGRLEDLEPLKQHVRSARAREEGKRHAIVESVIALKPGEMERITHALGKRLGTDVLLEQHTEPSLLAGLRIISDGWTFDASLKNRLQRLEQTLQ